jgi:CDP-2,3-bis-(O-geranylgeranyl)-sn-glycerol synthase
MSIVGPEEVISAFVFFLPAYVANTSAGFFGGGRPLDFGRTLRDKRRIFGDGKTIKGTAAGVVSGLIFMVGKNIYLSRSIFVEQNLAFLMAFGAMAGDLVGSFIKRRIGIESGESAPLLDQLDFALGALLLASLLTIISTETIIILLIITPIGHLGVNMIGFLAHKKEVPW